MVVVAVVMFVWPFGLFKASPPILHEGSSYYPWFASFPSFFFLFLSFVLFLWTHATVTYMRSSYFIVIRSLALPLDQL